MRTIVIDDEKQIREGLKILLSRISQIDIVGEASTIDTGKEIIEQQNPDLVLLDIQLKNKTGFDLLDSLKTINFHVVFITAYNEYTLKAFKYNAFDYLLKPIDPEELDSTIARLNKMSFNSKAQLKLLKENTNFEKIIINTSDQIFMLHLHEIIRCEADQGYTHFYTKDGKHVLSSKTLKKYDAIFPKEQFIRVHQSHLVNVNCIASYNKKGFLVLDNSEEIPVSVRKRQLLQSTFNEVQ